jgi:toxin ParE1/3/4
MAKLDLFYELSVEAEQDIDSIFDYTEEKYGFVQAVKYVADFDNTFERLIQFPSLGRERPEIRQELRSINKDEHVVFYRILDDRIRIVRILYRQQDLPQHIK